MGKLAEIKTKETQESVTDFINKIDDEQKRKDCFQIIAMMEKATGDKAKLWGTSIIGFGNLIYASPKTQREVEWFKLGFSPRKTNITLYLVGLDSDTRNNSLEKLGKYKTQGGCIYIKKLADVDLNVLENMIVSSAKK